jgi:hypothetical protein
MEAHPVSTELFNAFEDTREVDKIARPIEASWAAQGHPTVRCRVERVNVGNGRMSAYEVRSNLVRGLPPRG